MRLKDVFINETTGNIIRMLGFSEPIAKQFTQMNPRADFALAKSFVLWFMATYPNTNKDASKFKKDEDHFKYSFAAWKREIGQDLAETLKAKPALEKKINVAKTHEDVLEVVSAGMPEEDVVTLLDVGEGWKWVELTDKHHSKEARTMQHCATDGRGCLVSLRDPAGNPHVTMTYNKDENTVYQIKGKQNVVPKEDYHDAIIAFFAKTKSDIKDPFVKKRDKELFDKIKQTTGRDVTINSSELYAKLLEAISSDAAREWAWDTQAFTFDNANIEYEDVEEAGAMIGAAFQKAGYQSREIEPVSGMTTVYFYPAKWKKLSTDPLDRIEELPPYSDVEHSWQGMTLYVMAKDHGIVNPTVSQDLKGFVAHNKDALNAVYKLFQEIFSADQMYDADTTVNQECDNSIGAVEYEEFTGYEGSSGKDADHIESEKREKRWDEWAHSNLYGQRALDHFGPNYYDNPKHRELQKQMYAKRAAGEEPPETEEYR